MRVFISTYDGLGSPVGRAFAKELVQLGCVIDSSPRSPESGHEDERWNNWYSEGMKAAIHLADCFVAVIPVTSMYDGSTWMQAEFDEAFRRSREHGSPELFIYQLDSDKLPLGFDNYVSASQRLPHTPSLAAEIVVSSASA